MKNIVIFGGSKGISQKIAEQNSGENLFIYNRTGNGDISGTEYFSWDASSGLAPDTSFLPELIDGVVYAPGTIQLKPFHRIKKEEFLLEYQINTLSAVQALQVLFPKLQKSGNASVVLFSTVAVQTGMPFHAGIAMAKGAIEGLTRALAAEWSSANIRVNAIAPSLTDTPLAEKLLNTEEKRLAAAQRHPLKKIGHADDIAHMASFLLSDKSQWLTGQIIAIDGGLSSLKTL